MALEEILRGIRRWRRYSEEKGLDFNGYAASLPDGLVLVDPVHGDDALFDELAALGRPALILLTNKDHERASDELRRRFGAPVAIHEEEAGLLQVPPERTFGDGARLGGVLEAIRLRGLKSPAECAFLWREREILFVGDALAGLPSGLGLVKKHEGRPEALREAARLLDFPWRRLLVGDGEPVLGEAREALDSFLEKAGAPRPG